MTFKEALTTSFSKEELEKLHIFFSTVECDDLDWENLPVEDFWQEITEALEDNNG